MYRANQSCLAVRVHPFKTTPRTTTTKNECPYFLFPGHRQIEPGVSVRIGKNIQNALGIPSIRNIQLQNPT